MYRACNRQEKKSYRYVRGQKKELVPEGVCVARGGDLYDESGEIRERKGGERKVKWMLHVATGTTYTENGTREENGGKTETRDETDGEETQSYRRV